VAETCSGHGCVEKHVISFVESVIGLCHLRNLETVGKVNLIFSSRNGENCVDLIHLTRGG